MTIVVHPNVIQGSTEWMAMRCGLLTASNDKERAHLYELLSQRIVGYVEPGFEGDNMLRGYEDEIDARNAYSANYAQVSECGFVTNDRFGFKIGYSPDGLVDNDPEGEGEGLIECKSRKHKLQVETILSHVREGTIPPDFLIQCQTGLLVTERKWLDFISYSAGLPMVTIRIYPDPVVQEAIIAAATDFEIRLARKHAEFQQIMKSDARLLLTERRLDRELTV
jgi:hypothetical protein